MKRLATILLVLALLLLGGAVAFPDSDMPITVEAAFGADLTADPASWSFADVSTRLTDNPITKRVGRSAGAQQADAGSMSLTLDNSDGALTPLNPQSTYYPNVVLGLPIRVTINPTGTPTVWFSGYADSWTPDIIPTTEDGVMLSVVRVTASGILRRLSQGTGPLRSPLFRSVSGSAPSAHWSFEDGEGSKTAASAVANGRPLVVGGTTNFQSSLAPAGSAGAVDLSAGGYLTGPTGIGAGPVTSWEFEASFGWNTLPTLTAAADLLVGLKTPGSAVVEWGIGVLELSSTPRFGIYRLNSAGTLSVGSNGTTPIEPGRTYHFRIKMVQNGADVDYTRWLDGVANGSGTEAGVTLYAPTLITFNPRLSTTQMPHSVSHPAVWTPVRASAVSYLAADGHTGEMANERVDRLCREENIAATITGDSSQTMGPQTTGTLLENLQECETVNTGGLGESGFGLHFICLPERYNRPVDLTIDLATYRTTRGTSDQVLRPTFDDQRYRNRWTVDRPDGSQAIADLSEGGLLYEDSTTANVETDRQLLDQASWRVNRDSVVANRYPNTPVDLGANPSLIDDWLTVVPGLSRIVRTNLPADHLQDDIDEVVDGTTETLARRSWAAQYNGSPYAPYVVAELDDDTLGKLDTDGAELVSGVTSSATSLRVLTTTPGSPLWTTDAGEMPVPLVVAGEVMSATAIASLVVDPFTRSVANSWGSTPEGFTYTHDGTASAFNTTGTTATHTHTATNTGRLSRIDIGCPDARIRAVHSVPALASGVALVAYNVIRFADANNYYMARIGWTTGATITLTLRKRVAGVESNLLSVTIPALTHVAATRYVVDFECIGSSLAAKLWPESGTEPRNWQANTTDTDLTAGNWVGLRSVLDVGSTNVTPFLFTFDSFTVMNPQTMTVTRSVNSVAKAQSAGAAVNVHQPARLAL